MSPRDKVDLGKERRKKADRLEKYKKELRVDLVIAVVTQVDLQGSRFWLAKVKSEAKKTMRQLECLVSGGKFDKGEWVFELVYYGHMPGQSRAFRYRPELGTYFVRCSMIRNTSPCLVPLESWTRGVRG